MISTHIISKKGCSQINGKLIWILVDFCLLHCILDNAMKFTKDEGTITVMLEKKEKEKEELNNNAQQVIISIKETGEGIDPQILPRLFTKFATKSQTGGTGLGLFVCKGVLYKLMVVGYGLRIILMVKELHFHLAYL